MNRFPAQGLTATRSANSLITDSAAAATAIACGHTTNDGVIGLATDHATILPSIAERAKAHGMKVGILSSVSLDHATPAGFYAHCKSRNDYDTIARQLVTSNFDYFAGGQLRGGSPQLAQLAHDNGFKIIFGKAAFTTLQPGDRVIACASPVDRKGAMPYELDRQPHEASLADFTRLGIRLLDNPDGFFMMIEGGKIDWACHANDIRATIADTLALDDAIAVAHDFYLRHPDDTLIVVTADHECGGLSLGFTGTGYNLHPERLAGQTLSHDRLDEIIKQWEADGTPFEEVLPALDNLLGLPQLSKPQLEQLRNAYRHSISKETVHTPSQDGYVLYGRREPLTVAATRILAHAAGFDWASFSHTATPVTTSAIGPGHQLFNARYNNTAICHKLTNLMGLQ